MHAHILLAPAAAVPGVAALITIVIVAVILLVIIAVINAPQARVPEPWKTYATWIMAAILVIYLIWQALMLTGLV